MTKKALLLIVIVFLPNATFAQMRWTGRWSTNPPPKGWSGWTDSGSLNVFSESPSLFEPPVRRSVTPNELSTDVQLDLKVEGERVTGFVGVNGLWETPMRIQLGKIEGNAIRFMTTRTPPGREPIYYQWIIVLTDDNTMTLRRGNISGGRGGEGRPLPSGQQPAPAPTSLPALGRSGFNQATLTLVRVK